MSTTYTAETLHALLRALLAPSFAQRRTADQVLFQLYCGTGSEANPQLDSLLQQATQRFGAQWREFLQALVGWWLNASADSDAACRLRHQIGLSATDYGAWNVTAGAAWRGIRASVVP